MGLIFVFSSVQGSFIDSVGLGKESYHINAHFLLFVLLCISYYYFTRNILLSILLTMLYGVFDEIHQIFTPFRSASYFDMLVDSIGALIGGLIAWKLNATTKQKQKNL